MSMLDRSEANEKNDKSWIQNSYKINIYFETKSWNKKAQSDILLKFTRKVCKLSSKYWGLIKVFFLLSN